MDKTIQKTMENLEKNNIGAFYAETAADALEKLKQLLPSGCSVSVGGSVTLSQCGVLDFLKTGGYDYIDRYDPSLDRKGVTDVFVRALSADAYITSSNAITQDGKLYNTDGNGNRIAALCFGPKSVIVIAGKNKIVSDIDEAQLRIKTVAAPKNCQRLSCDTYCSKTGKCVAADKNFEGCTSKDRICSTYVVTSYQRNAGRIKVIIVNEDLGY